MVTHSPPIFEVGGLNLGTSRKDDGQQFTVRNLDQLYVLVSSAYKTARSHMV